MRDDHNRIAGFTGLILLAASAVGAAGPVNREVPVRTAVSDSPRQTARAVSAEPVSANEFVAPPAKVAGECAGIVVRATESVFSDNFETGDTGSWGTGALARFSASRILDLELTVSFTDGLVGDHLLRLKLLTPKGHHYQTLSVPMTSIAKRQGGRRRVEGYPRPLAIRTMKKSGALSLPEIELSVPVGGTPIVTSSIFGTWTAEVYLDDASEVCVSQSFVLTP